MTTQLSKQGSTPYSETGITNDRSTLLRRVLLGNAIFSTLCALLLIVDTGSVATFLGWPLQWPLRVIGLGLLPFAFFVFQTARRVPLDKRFAWVVVELDLVWVIGSIVILLLHWPSTTTVGGSWAVGIVAEIVATFAILQVIGLRRMGKG